MSTSSEIIIEKKVVNEKFFREWRDDEYETPRLTARRNRDIAESILGFSHGVILSTTQWKGISSQGGYQF